MPNPINIKELIADREAGVQGDFVLNEETGWLESEQGPCGGGHYFSLCMSATDENDKRRLLRLPDLEAAYIEAVELLRSIADRKWNTMTEGCNAAAAAQSAARKFLGETE